MSDLLGEFKFDGVNNDITHDIRFNVDQGLVKSQSFAYTNENILGKSNLKLSLIHI